MTWQGRPAAMASSSRMPRRGSGRRRCGPALKVNRELVLLYRQIGREILARPREARWGAKVVERLAADLRRELREMAGFLPAQLEVHARLR
jgi:hypothetical protein